MLWLLTSKRALYFLSRPSLLLVVLCRSCFFHHCPWKSIPFFRVHLIDFGQPGHSSDYFQPEIIPSFPKIHIEIYVRACMPVCSVAKLCPTLCDPMDCSLLGSSVRGIPRARILEWVAIPFSRGSFWPRDWTQVSCIAGGFFTTWATSEAQ